MRQEDSSATSPCYGDQGRGPRHYESERNLRPDPRQNCHGNAVHGRDCHSQRQPDRWRPCLGRSRAMSRAPRTVPARRAHSGGPPKKTGPTSLRPAVRGQHRATHPVAPRGAGDDQPRTGSRPGGAPPRGMRSCRWSESDRRAQGTPIQPTLPTKCATSNGVRTGAGSHEMYQSGAAREALVLIQTEATARCRPPAGSCVFI